MIKAKNKDRKFTLNYYDSHTRIMKFKIIY